MNTDESITARLDALEAREKARDACWRFLYDECKAAPPPPAAAPEPDVARGSERVRDYLRRALSDVDQETSIFLVGEALRLLQCAPHPDAEPLPDVTWVPVMQQAAARLAPCPPPAAPCALDRLLQAADQVLDDMQDGTSCCPAARDALRDALVPFRARLAEIDGVPAAPCADEVEVVARAIRDADIQVGDRYSQAAIVLAALAPLRQTERERERAWREGAEAMREACKRGVLGGRFLHDQAPPAQFARECAEMLDRLPLPPMGGV